MPTDAEIRALLQDQSLSYWLRDALTSALDRDPVDAAADAGLLSAILDRRADEIAARALAALTLQRAKNTG
jgi:hypothetical protein